LQDSKRQFETQLDFAKHPKDLTKQTPNGLRYLRWGIGAIRFGCKKNSTAGKMLGMPQNPQRQVHALLGGGFCWNAAML